MVYPDTRLRRMRATPAIRDMVQETRISPADFIYPLFVTHGTHVHKEISSMPEVYHISIDQLENEMLELQSLGIHSVLLFGLPSVKDAIGTENFSDSGIVQQAIREIKRVSPDTVVITDVCMCEYTANGHCGVVHGNEILNDETLEILCRVATSHADAGADFVAPSGMMDGMVVAIRHALDSNSHSSVGIISYAIKFASSFYGPFRDAVASTPEFGDRHSHQMNPANAREALREAELDIAEGADMLIVKPSLAYLDIVQKVRERWNIPVVAYNVSGEYSMVKAAALHDWIDERKVVLELLLGIKRAGADLMVTYHAKEAARWLTEQTVSAPAEILLGYNTKH